VRRGSGETITCAFDHSANGAFTVSVTMAERTVYSEEFPDVSEAIAHAAFLLKDYVQSGWTEVLQRDSRIAWQDGTAAET
jgi:hypothetical protein